MLKTRSLPIASTLLGALFVLLTAACGETPSAPPAQTSPQTPASETAKPDANDAPAAKPAPDTLAGFRVRMEDLLRICAEGTTAEAEANARDLLMRDPRVWFQATFGADLAEGLAKEYAIWHARIPGLPAEVRKNRAKGRTAIFAERFDETGDVMSTAYQSIALRKAKRPLTLYSLRLVEPGDEDGWHLWSFAWVDGAYRFVGRMMALSPASAVKDLALMGSLRIKAAREIRAERAKAKAEVQK